MNFLGNAFSPNMVGGDAILALESVQASDVPADAASCVGHESTAVVLSKLLGRPVPVNRVAVHLGPSDQLFLVAIFAGDGKPYRPPEGKVLTEADLNSLRLEFRCITRLS
jgi:hypothetical protein